MSPPLPLPILPLDHHIFISNNNKNNTLGLALRTPATLSLSPTTTTTAASSVKHDYEQQQLQPSLTLSLLFPAATQQQNNLSSNCDDVSSFSNSFVGVKREREDQLDASANSNDVYEDDVSNTGGRKTKLRLNKRQSALLEDSFKLHTTLNPKQKEALARQLNLRQRQVEVWFQNRRARTKLKQTEVDCKFLKKCCERLAAENEKLHKELQHLKSLNKLQQQPFYMHHLPLPATSRLSSTSSNYMQYCPSCHQHQQVQVQPKITSNDFLISSKKRILFNPFTKAAC